MVQLIERFSVLQRDPWSVTARRTSSGDLHAIGAAAGDVVRRVAAGEYQRASIARKREKPNFDQLMVGYDLERTRLELTLDVAVQGEAAQRFFEQLMNLLRPAHALYIPVFFDPLGWQDTVLEMALERNYTAFGYEEGAPEVGLARAIATALPRLSYSMPDPEAAPSRIGWLNYWSPQVASMIGFPDRERDAGILPLCHQAVSGAWFVKLTDEPLDLHRPDHIETLAWAFWRFDRIGKRMRQVAKKTSVRGKPGEVLHEASRGERVFVLRERDANGQWWDSAVKPITAASAEDALRIHFAHNAYSRGPKQGESLAKLSAAYDLIAAEVGLTRSGDFEAVEVRV